MTDPTPKPNGPLKAMREQIRRAACLIALLLLCCWHVSAQSAPGGALQETPRFEVAGDYTYVRSNAPPGQCGCFSMNGGSAEAAFNLVSYIGAVANFSVVNTGSVAGSSSSLTLFSYVFGPRFIWRNHTRFLPFAEVLVGGAHASGLGYGGSTGSSTAVAESVGGGLDLAVTPRVAVRLVDADYYLTRFANGVNSNENNLRLSFGVVLRFGAR